MSPQKKIEADLSDEVMSVVLAGGQGTRLFPLTLKKCKPSISFGSRFRLIDIPISNSLNSGIRHIAVISQYFASELNQHIANSYRLDQFGKGQFYLLSPEETPGKKIWYEGTADAVRQNLEHLLNTTAEYFLILSGDQLYTFDFREMLKFAKQKQADLVVASLAVPEKEAKRMGLLKIDDQHQIIDFYEKPSEPHHLQRFCLPHNPLHSNEPQYLGSMGIYIFKRAALISILQENGVDFGKHIIPMQIKRGKTYSFAFNGYWEDIGTIGSYYHANLALTKRHIGLDIYNEKFPIYCEPLYLPGAYIVNTKIEHSILGQGSKIFAEEILESIVGLKAHIGKGSKIHRSIILGSQSPSSIGEHCVIEKAIIDENVRIGNNVRLTNKNSLTHYDGDGIFVRDGIIIVINGTNLPDGFSF
jgi:glucose-1-phosphate adenylyltransferase